MDINKLTGNYVFSVELIMITGIVLLTLYIFFKLGLFRSGK